MSSYLSSHNQIKSPIRQVAAGSALLITAVLGVGGVLSLTNRGNSDPCASEWQAPNDTGRNAMLKTPNGKTFWVEAFFDAPDEVRVLADGRSYQFDTKSSGRLSSEVHMPIDATSDLFIRMTASDVTTSCQPHA